MRIGRIDMQRLHEALRAKGIDAATALCAEPLSFTQTQVHSWFKTDRRPRDGDAVRIASAFELPFQWLCGLSGSEYERKSVGEVAARESLECLRRTDSRIRGPVLEILERYSSAPGAPKWAADWLRLYEDVIRPATFLGQEQEREAQRMLQRATPRQPRSDEGG
jgi:hypothetical protein